jgi:hypothetical protein
VIREPREILEHKVTLELRVILVLKETKELKD